MHKLKGFFPELVAALWFVAINAPAIINPSLRHLATHYCIPDPPSFYIYLQSSARVYPCAQHLCFHIKIIYGTISVEIIYMMVSEFKKMKNQQKPRRMQQVASYHLTLQLSNELWFWYKVYNFLQQQHYLAHTQVAAWIWFYVCLVICFYCSVDSEYVLSTKAVSQDYTTKTPLDDALIFFAVPPGLKNLLIDRSRSPCMPVFELSYARIPQFQNSNVNSVQTEYKRWFHGFLRKAPLVRLSSR